MVLSIYCVLTSRNCTVRKETQSLTSVPEEELGPDMGGETESKPYLKLQWLRPTSLDKILDSTLFGRYLFPSYQPFGNWDISSKVRVPRVPL